MQKERLGAFQHLYQTRSKDLGGLVRLPPPHPYAYKRVGRRGEAYRIILVILHLYYVAAPSSAVSFSQDREASHSNQSPLNQSPPGTLRQHFDKLNAGLWELPGGSLCLLRKKFKIPMSLTSKMINQQNLAGQDGNAIPPNELSKIDPSKA